MKRFGKLFALLLALAFCLALLPLSAMADYPVFTYVKGTKRDLGTIPVSSKLGYGVLKVHGTGGPAYGSVFTLNNREYYFDGIVGGYLLVFNTSFLESIPEGKYSVDKMHINLAVKGSGGDWPPATPTDLGHDEPDEVLYVGGMSGGGAARVAGGKAAESEVTTSSSTVQTATVSLVILPENASSANPATGVAI